MKLKISSLFLAIILFAILSIAQDNISDFPLLQGPYLGQKPPGDKAEIFAPGIISTELTEHGSVSFSPDGNTVFWATIYSDPFRKKIMTMEKINNKWTPPKIASFSLGTNEGNPFYSPDGKKVFFTGWRTADGYDGEKHLIMFSEKTETGWGDPTLINPAINSISKYWHISVASNGNLYFKSEKDDGGIYCSKYENGQFAQPAKIELGISGGGTPSISANESYIIFTTSDRPDGYGEIDLYISYKKKDGSWTQATNLGEKINSKSTDIWPIISPDGKYLFFTSSRSGNMDIYWVNTSIIDNLKPTNLK